MLVALKQLDEVAAVVKAAVVSDGSYGGIGGAQKGTGMFNAVIV